MVTDEALERAVGAVLDGDVVALPTDTVYGVGALAASRTATARIFSLKGRDEQVALPVLVASAAVARSLVDGSPKALAAFDALAARYWPGALTIVMHRSPGVDFALGGDEGTIGVRCPASPVARALLERTGPMAVTSANRSGASPAVTAAEVAGIFGNRIVVVDGGRCDGLPSTVVSLVEGTPKIVRAGPLSEAEIDAAIQSR